MESTPILVGFRALARSSGWEKNSPIYRREKKRFIGSAVVEAFRRRFGGNASSLEAWQSLSRELGVVNPPDSIEECKQVRV
jgi:hypothetical protein